MASFDVLPPCVDAALSRGSDDCVVPEFRAACVFGFASRFGFSDSFEFAFAGNGSILAEGFELEASAFGSELPDVPDSDPFGRVEGSLLWPDAGGFVLPIGEVVSIESMLMPTIRPFGRDRSSRTGSYCVVSTLDRFPAVSRASIRT